MSASPRLQAEMARLKPFQRRTVDTVVRRLWDDADPVDWFLVADEVGLGKTLVARGVIAHALDRFARPGKPVRVLYICSNLQIANQNLPKLALGDDQRLERNPASRLSMLAAVGAHTSTGEAVFNALTPQTSFTFGTSMGVKSERALIYLMAESEGLIRPDAREGWMQILRGSAELASFRGDVDWSREFNPPDSDVAREFAAGLRDGLAWGDATWTLGDVEELAALLAADPGAGDGELRDRRAGAIDAMRAAVTRIVARELDPDLIIMDEFQNFTSLLNDQSPEGELLQTLLGVGRQDGHVAKVLLLSATPYRMYSAPGDDETAAYDGFLATIRTMTGGPDAVGAAGADAEEAARPNPHERAIRGGLRDMRRALAAGDVAGAEAAKAVVEHELRRVMVRTERLASTPERDGMLEESPGWRARLTPEDIADYRALSKVARTLHTYDPLELWRSSPYTLAVADPKAYTITKGLAEALKAEAPELRDVAEGLRERGHVLDLSAEWVKEGDLTRPLDPANPKARAMFANVLDGDQWRLAWVPPAMPYHRLGGAFASPAARDFTKKLVFSSWRVAPKGIATVTSFEAERRAAEACGESGRPYGHRWPAMLGPTLRTVAAGQALDRVSTWALLYPSATLAQLGDPLTFARETGRTLPVDPEAHLAWVEERVNEVLVRLPRGTGAADPAWYGLAAVFLDRPLGDSFRRLADLQIRDQEGDDARGRKALDQHIRTIDAMGPAHLGGRPADLARVLAEVAVSSPANCLLRSLARTWASGDDPMDDAGNGPADALKEPAVRRAAARLAWAMRGFFDRSHMRFVVRAAAEARSAGAGGPVPAEAEATMSDRYMRDVLRYCLEGDLQAVLDEYLHQESEARGLVYDADDREGAFTGVVDTLAGAVGIRTSQLGVRSLAVGDDLSIDASAGIRIRCRYAMVYDDQTSETAENRKEVVRDAFNSPFWPFVLATTSAGQEGIDFHRYCHEVVHWNLPSNPIDFEQREGRIHRYKGHAVRRNVAAEWGSDPSVRDASDPWARAFECAEAAVLAEDGDAADGIRPGWVYTGSSAHPARIRRAVPALPMSRETAQKARLLRDVARYRLALGQPRQSEFLRLVPAEVQADRELMDRLTIDLSPGADPA